MKFDKNAVIKEGENDFTVAIFKEAFNEKTQQQMVTIALRIHGTLVNDFFMEKNDVEKIRKFCESVGRTDIFDSGNFEEDQVLGLTGRCNIIFKDNGDYGKQPRVKAYISKSSHGNLSIDDQIPF